VKPELVATRPDEIYTWDVTELQGPAKWTYFYLYTVVDIYSRYIRGWMLARAERAGLAQAVLEETIDKQEIAPGQLTIHSGRGSPMIVGRSPTCWPTSASRSRTAGRTRATTTPTSRATSGPSSTGRTSRIPSGR